MKYFLIPLLLLGLFGLAFATEPKIIIMEQYMPEVELLPDAQIKFGEIFTIHVWLPTYENKPDSLGYIVDVLDKEGNQIDSSLWSAKEDFIYEFDTTHPLHNITYSGIYFIKLERTYEMQRTGVKLKPLEFEIIKHTCRADLFLAFRADDSRTACVKPYTLDKLIQRGWAKPHTDMDSLSVKPIKDAKIKHCPEGSRLIQGGYYVTDDSTLTVSQKRFDYNGWMVEFSNPEEYKQDSYVFVDCVSGTLQPEPTRTPPPEPEPMKLSELGKLTTISEYNIKTSVGNVSMPTYLPPEIRIESERLQGDVTTFFCLPNSIQSNDDLTLAQIQKQGLVIQITRNYDNNDWKKTVEFLVEEAPEVRSKSTFKGLDILLVHSKEFNEYHAITSVDNIKIEIFSEKFDDLQLEKVLKSMFNA